MLCNCALAFDVQLGKPGDYERFKEALNRGRHPTFVGRDTVNRQIDNGGLLFFVFGGMDVAVSLVQVKNNSLLVLNVHPAHRSHGLGGAVVKFLKCNWVRATEQAVPFFVRHGYKSIGAIKQGRTLRTQVMVRENLITMAGRVSAALGGGASPDDAGHASEKDGRLVHT